MSPLTDAPPDLVELQHVGWFDVDAQARTIGQIRRRVPENQDPLIPGMLVGYPRFARFTAGRFQAFGSFAIWGLLKRFDEPPPRILGTERAAEIVLDLDLPTTAAVSGDGSELAQFIVRQLEELTAV
jgi:hypothetical protein